jgi:hypothetical protein
MIDFIQKYNDITAVKPETIKNLHLILTVFKTETLDTTRGPDMIGSHR